jgi:hypothetical protein
MNRPGSKDILFWSPKCQYSANLIEKIQNTPLMNNINMFNVHNKQYTLPANVRSVPTLFLANQRTFLVNESLSQWINQQLHNMTNQQISSGNMPGNTPPTPTGHHSNPNVGNYTHPSQQSSNKKPLSDENDDLTGEKSKKFNGNITDYNPTEMSSGFSSDTYSFLENDKAVASHGFAFIGDADETPAITNIDKSNADMGDFPTGDSSNNNSNSSMEYNPNPPPPPQNNNFQYNPNPPPQNNNFQYNPNPPSNPPSQNNNFQYNPNMGGNNMGGNNMGDNPFASSTNDNRKKSDFDQKYEQLMKDRDLNDSLGDMNAGMYQ